MLNELKRRERSRVVTSLVTTQYKVTRFQS